MRMMVAICGVLMANEACTASLLDRNIDELYGQSIFVAEGKVVGIVANCNEIGCSSEIRLAVETPYKGSLENGSDQTACSMAPVIAGFTYVFFFEPATKSTGNEECKFIR